MNTKTLGPSAFALACGALSCGHPSSAAAPPTAIEDPAPPPAPPSTAPLDESAVPPTVSQPAAAPVSTTVEVAPPATRWVASYPTGQWVYTETYGWIWVPANSVSTAEDGVPYVYLYTPRYGWTWYVSPWGEGRYHYGPWVRHPWAPVGWHHGWVDRPHVVVHMGGHGGHRR